MDVNFAVSQSEENASYDVIVIGGGPAGSSAAIYAARADLRTLVIDKGLTAGALGMASKIANYPGLPEPVEGPELARRIRDQARSFGAEFVTEKVLRVDLESDPKHVWTGESDYEGRSVIIATGAMGRGRRLPGEEELLGRGVSYCATCDAAFFRQQDVAVVGNNDEAVEEALVLARFAAQVHFFSPTSELNASSHLAEDLKSHPKVALHSSASVRAIEGEQQVESVRVSMNGDVTSVPVEGVFIYLQGTVPVTDFLDGQLLTSDEGCLMVDDNFQTQISGVFAVGDVLCRHVKQAAVAASEGVQAGMAADRYLHGRKNLRPDWARW